MESFSKEFQFKMEGCSIQNARTSNKNENVFSKESIQNEMFSKNERCLVRISIQNKRIPNKNFLLVDSYSNPKKQATLLEWQQAKFACSHEIHHCEPQGALGFTVFSTSLAQCISGGIPPPESLFNHCQTCIVS